ncbi:hypothetical protein [Halalkalicoccus sp. NIPERK01]|uniref:hypothetical protein n=1 Tax=Halalkalicoccus sp. NIPERK01 TaxID=3053469 RepID=UPI00256F0997|nr:hypothetical protein [Halalkalicoccus sp. NIPERK01]MDL5361354.1 hypothetical protein [Halalkalicoccus sp. NIPERK01]
MAGMQLLGTAAFLDGLEDMIDYHTPDTDGYRIGNTVDYVDDQEFGAKNQPGTPHFRPGMDATRAQLAQIAVQASGIDEFMRLSALRWHKETTERAPVDLGTLKAGWTIEEL